MAEVVGLAVGLAASVIAIIEVSGKVTEKAWGFVAKTKNRHEEMRNLAASLTCHHRILKELQKRIQHDSSFEGRMSAVFLDGPSSPLKAAFDNLVELLAALEGKKADGAGRKGINWKGLIQNAAQAATWPLLEKQIRRHVAELERVENLILVALQADGLADNRKVFDIVEATHELSQGLVDSNKRRIQEHVRDEFLAALLGDGCPKPHESASSGHLQDTGQWLLDTNEVQSWLRGGFDRPTWLCGMPGAGKTYLTTAIVRHVLGARVNHNPDFADVGVAYHFYTADEDHKSTIPTSEMLLRSLGYQLAYLVNPLPEEVYAIYNRWLQERRAPNEEELINIIQILSARFSRTIIIIDGLPQGDSSSSLLNTINILHKHGNSVLVSSLPHREDISHALPDAFAVRVQIRPEDIRLYLLEQLKRDPHASDLIGGEVDTVVRKLAYAADGIFLSVVLNIQMLLQQPTASHFRSALEDLKGGGACLERSYKSILERLLQRRETVDLAIRALTWIVHSKGRMTLGQLQTALAINSEDTELDGSALIKRAKLVEICAGFVWINRTDLQEYVELIHPTAKQFLIDRLSSPLPEDPHWVIASTLCTYLTFHEFRKGDYDSFILSLSTCAAGSGGASLLQYCRASLMWHLNQLDVDGARSLFESILSTERCGITLTLLLEDQLVVGKTGSFITSLSPLHVAVMFGSVGAVRDLIRNGADVTAIAQGGVVPMHLVFWARLHFEEIVVELHKHGGWVPDADGFTPVMYAIKAPFEWELASTWSSKWTTKQTLTRSYIEYIIAVSSPTKANIKQQSFALPSWTCVPLNIAVLNNDIKAVNLLLLHGASPSVVDGTGSTALDLAFKKFEMPRALKFPFEANITSEGYDSHDSVSELCLSLLEKAGTDDFRVNNYIVSAAYGGNLALVTELLRKSPSSPCIPWAFIISAMSRPRVAAAILRLLEPTVFISICLSAWEKCEGPEGSPRRSLHGQYLAEQLSSYLVSPRGSLKKHRKPQLSSNVVDWRWIASFALQNLCQKCRFDNINGRQNAWEHPPLHNAVYRATAAFLKLSLPARQGTFASQTSTFEKEWILPTDRPFMMSYHECQKEIDFLIEHGADLDRVSHVSEDLRYGQTPLSIAVSAFDLATTRILMKGGSDPRVPLRYLDPSISQKGSSYNAAFEYNNPLERWVKARIADIQAENKLGAFGIMDLTEADFLQVSYSLCLSFLLEHEPSPPYNDVEGSEVRDWQPRSLKFNPPKGGPPAIVTNLPDEEDWEVDSPNVDTKDTEFSQMNTIDLQSFASRTGIDPGYQQIMPKIPQFENSAVVHMENEVLEPHYPSGNKYLHHENCGKGYPDLHHENAVLDAKTRAIFQARRTEPPSSMGQEHPTPAPSVKIRKLLKSTAKTTSWETEAGTMTSVCSANSNETNIHAIIPERFMTRLRNLLAYVLIPLSITANLISRARGLKMHIAMYIIIPLVRAYGFEIRSVLPTPTTRELARMIGGFCITFVKILVIAVFIMLVW